MGRPKDEYIVTREVITHFSAFDELFTNKAVFRGQLVPNDLGSIAVWLAENGTPEIRAAMARRLVPAALGVLGRNQAENDRIMGQIGSIDLCLLIYKIENKKRETRSGKISKNRTGLGKGSRRRSR